MPCSCCNDSCSDNKSSRTQQQAVPGSITGNTLSDTDKKELFIIGAAFLTGTAGLILHQTAEKAAAIPAVKFIALGLLLVSYLAAGFDVLKAAFCNILKGKFFDEFFLMSVATIGALIIGAMEEAVGVMIFYRIGEFFQDRAVQKSQSSIAALLAMKPTSIRIKTQTGYKLIEPGAVQPGDIIAVRAGERIPVDGVVEHGEGTIDTSAVTGESIPRAIAVPDTVFAGCTVLDTELLIRAEKRYEDSTIARIMHLVEEATDRKAKTERFITKFARWYTPAVVFAAFGIAMVPPLLIPGEQLSLWAYRALVMLVISCPCAFVLSVPLAYFAGLGGMAKHGILVKGAFVIDSLADARTVVFDKTGTLTDGKFKVTNIVPAEGQTQDELLSWAALASVHSNHPLSRAIQDLHESYGSTKTSAETPFEKGIVPASMPDYKLKTISTREIRGKGIEAVADGIVIHLGNDSLLHHANIPHVCETPSTSVVHVAVAGMYAGKIEFGDSLKPDSKTAVAALKKQGIQRIVMLTGDSETPAKSTAAALNISEVHHSLLPENKLAVLDSIFNESKGTVLYAGDGINDAPVLARADAGIAMGNLGSEAAIESANVVLMTDEPCRIADAVSRARKTRRIVIENIVFALGVKTVFLAFGAFGLASMWEAVIADVGVALIAVINAGRALR